MSTVVFEDISVVSVILQMRTMTIEEKARLEIDYTISKRIIEFFWKQENGSSANCYQGDCIISSGASFEVAIGHYVDYIGEGEVQYFRYDQLHGEESIKAFSNLGLRALSGSGSNIRIVET